MKHIIEELEKRRSEASVRDARAVVEAFFASGGEDHAAFLDFGEADAEKIDHRRRRHFSRQHFAEELDAAHPPTRFDVS